MYNRIMNISYLKNKYHEAFIVDPSDLGNPILTKIYKRVSGNLKIMPFIYLVPISIAIIFTVSLLFNFSIVRIATLLQNGF